MEAEALSVKKYYTYDEYIEILRQSDIRYEYFDGEILAMAGGSLNHSDITYNLARCFNDAFRKRGCRCFREGVMLELEPTGKYAFPDILLTCDSEDVNADYEVKHLLLIAEVLSPSTEKFDRRKKEMFYRRLPSLKYYLLVSQYEPLVHLYSRNEPTALFGIKDYSEINDVILFPDLNFSLSLQQIYENIQFKSS